jgi:hypothetical protein
MSRAGGSPIERLLGALGRSIDEDRLRRELDDWLGAAVEARSTPPPTGGEPPGEAAKALLSRFALADILDDSILGARPGQTSFPLRLLFGALAERAGADDTAFALGSGLNFYFRVAMDEEAKVRLGIEVSRLYYRFVLEAGMEPALVKELSPLLAKLMSTELERLKLEATDHVTTFDSALHERDGDADPTSPAVRRPATFLARITGNNMVRFKALVTT